VATVQSKDAVKVLTVRHCVPGGGGDRGSAPVENRHSSGDAAYPVLSASNLPSPTGQN